MFWSKDNTFYKSKEELRSVSKESQRTLVVGECQEYLNGANRSFIKKWKADIRYIKNMEANGKGIRVFRFLILTLLGIFFVPYCYIKYKLN